MCGILSEIIINTISSDRADMFTCRISCIIQERHEHFHKACIMENTLVVAPVHFLALCGTWRTVILGLRIPEEKEFKLALTSKMYTCISSILTI